MKPKRIATLALLLLGFACAKGPDGQPATDGVRPSLPTASESPADVATPPAAEAPIPTPWATTPEPTAPPGFAWRTVHHETIHARLLVPDGAELENTRDAHGYPRVDFFVDGEMVILQFDSGVAHLGNTLAKTPPTVFGLPTEKAHVGPENLAAQYRTAMGDLRIMGFAPGVKCTFEAFRDVPAETLDRIFTACASLRWPAFGAWRRATPEERANGGMTDIPAGAWVENALPSHPGSLLRPGKFFAHLHLGGLAVSGAVCPQSIEPLRERSVGEVEVTVEERKTPGGEVWIRRVTEVYEDHQMPGPTRIFAWRDGGCCRADFVPWTMQPTAAEIDYAIALCDTFRIK